jgi:hypothetical protein
MRPAGEEQVCSLEFLQLQGHSPSEAGRRRVGLHGSWTGAMLNRACCSPLRLRWPYDVVVKEG